jgi:hypothetical protein
VTRALIEGGADISIRDGRGFRAVEWSHGRHMSLVREIMDGGQKEMMRLLCKREVREDGSPGRLLPIGEPPDIATFPLEELLAVQVPRTPDGNQDGVATAAMPTQVVVAADVAVPLPERCQQCTTAEACVRCANCSQVQCERCTVQLHSQDGRRHHKVCRAAWVVPVSTPPSLPSSLSSCGR